MWDLKTSFVTAPALKVFYIEYKKEHGKRLSLNDRGLPNKESHLKQNK